MNANVNAGAEALGQALVENLHRVQAKLPRHATPNDWYMALAHTIRDRLMDRYIAHLETLATYRVGQGRRVPVRRVPDGAAPREQPAEPRPVG